MLGDVLGWKLHQLGYCPLVLSILELVPHRFDRFRRDFRRTVSPVGPHVREDGSELLVGILALPSLHRIIKRLPFDLDRTLQALKHNRDQPVASIA